MKNLTLPLNNTQIKSLKAGEVVSLSGKVYTARDAAHKRFFELIDAKKELPFDLNCSAIYYCGISPAKDNEIIGACGPTTSARMDFYTPLLLQRGLKVMIGKGKRSDEVNKAIKENGAVYFAAIGGAGALIKNRVTSSNIKAFEDLGCEAVYEIEFKDLEVIVATDSNGNSFLM